MLKMINSMAMTIPTDETVHMQIKRGRETVLKTFFTIVLSCGIFPPIHRSAFNHVKLSAWVS